MSRYDLVINGHPFEVEILELHASHARVDVNGVEYDVEIPAQKSAAPVPVATTPTVAAPAAAPKPAAAPAAAGSGTITSPMPGSVWAIPVSVGDAVEAGTTVIVIEAMKMENEIKTPTAGTVKEILVDKAQEVAVGAPLVVVG